MDDPNDYLIPELNSLSLEDSSNRSQWYSSGRRKQTPQLLNNQGYHPYFSPGGRSPKSIPKNDSTYPDTLVNFPQPPLKVQFPISPPPTNSQPKRSVPLPALNSSPDKASITMPFCRPFGGLLDSPLVYKHVGLTGQHALISPPPTLPMTTRTLPPTDSPHLRVIPEHEDLCREEGAPNDHEHRAHDPNEFQPSLLGLSSPRSHPNALCGGMNIPSTSTQSNPWLSPISPEWRVGRMHPEMTSPPYSYYPPIDSDSGASTSGSILLQHRPEFAAHTLERLDGPEMYDTPLSPVTSPFSRSILPPLDISSLLDSPSPSSCELSAYDCSPPSPPHTALARGHPFIRDHNTNFVDGHDPQRLYTQKRKYLRNPQMSPGSPPNPADQDELSILSPYDYGYDSKPLKVFDDIPENDDDSDMDLSDDQLQEVLLATPEPSSPQPLPVAPPDPPPISDDLPDLAHEFAPGEMPWSPSLRAFSDLPDLDDGAGDDSEDFGSTSGSSSSSQFMDIDHFTESPKPSLLSLPGADIDEDLIPIDDDDETLLSAFPSPPSHQDNGLRETPVPVHEESMKSWLPELDSNPFLGGSSSSAHWLPKPSSSTLPTSTATYQTPSASNANEAGPSTARPPPPKRRSSSLLLVGEGMDDTPRNDGESALSGENPLPPWRSSLTGGRERDEEDALIMQADASSDVELRRLSELMRKALRDEREAREAETRVLSGGTISGSSGWEIPASLSSSSSSGDVGPGGGRHLPTITRGAGIDMTAKREARKAKKKARERAREIGTMMKLKMAESGLQTGPSASTSPGSPDPSDFAMSGDETSSEAPSTNKRRKGALGEAKSMDELVAKMMLRRHASYRSLANRKTPLPPGRKYASSPLVRTRSLPEVTEDPMGDIVDAGFSVDADGEEMEEAAEMHKEDHERDPWTMEQD